MLEVIFLAFVLFETYKIYKILKEEWDFLTSLEQQQRTVKMRTRDGAYMRFLHCIRVEPHRIEGQNFVVVLVNIIKGLCLTAFASVFKIARLIMNILKKSFFNALDMISMVLMYTQIAIWGKIIKRGEFLTDSGSPVNVIQICGGVAHYFETYVIVSTLSIALIFVRMLQYFTFSKKLSAFSEIMSAAAFDIIFFGIMWCFMVFGFAIAFFAVYGREIASLRAVSTSLLSTLKMSMNEFNFDEMSQADHVLTIIFFIIFITIFKVLLGNMFIAIISAHYFQFQREAAEDGNGEEDAGFFGLILSIIRNNLKTSEEDDDEESPEGAGAKDSKKKHKGGLLR